MSHNPGGKLHVCKHRSFLRAVKFRCWWLHDFIAALLFLVLYTGDVLIYHLFKVGEWRRTLTENLESKQDFVRYLLEKLRFTSLKISLDFFMVVVLNICDVLYH